MSMYIFINFKFTMKATWAMKFLLCIGAFLIVAFAEQLGCFVNENAQSIVFVKDGETKNLNLKNTYYKNQKCGYDGEFFYIANLNNEIIEIANERNFLFAVPNVGCKISNIQVSTNKIYVACDMASEVSISVFDKDSEKLLAKNYKDIYKISNFLLLNDSLFFTSFNGKAFLLGKDLALIEKKNIGFAPISACKIKESDILVGFRDGEILDFKSGAKKQILKSKISALACVGDEVFVGGEDGIVYKFDKDLKLKGQKVFFSEEIKEIFIDKNVLICVNLNNEIKSLEINSF